jgi:hypothetical protein
MCLLVATTSLIAACDDPPDERSRPMFERGDPDAGPGTSPRFAVLSSDFTATAVSLLDAKGELLADDYIDSAAAPAGLTTALSGDVALATRSGESGVLVLLDRFKNDVVSRIELSTGDVLGQVKTHTPSEQGTETGYSSNPQDYVRIDESSAWVSRFEPNLDPEAAEIDRGSDLLELDPTRHERTGERIDLSVLNTEQISQNAETMEDEPVTLYARPSRFVRVGDTLVVGLGRLSFDFLIAGDGAVALIDLKTKEVGSLELPGLQSCGSVVPVAGSSDRVIVSCAGQFGPNQHEGAALLLLRVRAGKAEIEAEWRGSEHPDAPRMVDGPVSLGGTRVAAIAYGQSARAASDFGPAAPEQPDRYGVVDLETGMQALLLEDATPGSLGSGVYDPKSKLLLVPDGSSDEDKRPTAGVRRFAIGASEIEQLELVPVTERLALPARQIAPL